MGGEEVLHCEFAWVSAGVSVRVWALLVITDPVTFGSPVVLISLLLKRFHLAVLAKKFPMIFRAAVGEGC